MEILGTLETIEALLFLVLIYMVKVVVFFIILVFIRPLYQNWGTSREEKSCSLPGDTLVTCPKLVSTRAIDINAPVEKVWPWIIQIGYQRAGWYNYDMISRILGMANYVDGWRSADRIVPHLQDLKVRDRVKLTRSKGYIVAEVSTARFLVLHGNKPGNSHSWVYFVEPFDNATKTRLIVRHRNKYSGWKNKLLFECLDIGFFVMERSHMLGLKSLAEGTKSCSVHI